MEPVSVKPAVVALLVTITLFCASVSALGKPVKLISITVTPSSASVPVGLTKQYQATGTYSDGTTMNLTSRATWSSSSSAVATVNAAGLATAQAIGSVAVTAKYTAVAGTASLQAVAATLTSIRVTPSNASILVGQRQQFTATGIFSDGTTGSITNTVTWTSSAPAVATIDTAGLAVGIAAGSATVTATSGSVTANATFSVGLPLLTSISVTPSNPSAPVGQMVQFTATGTYSDGGTHNLTSVAVWVSSAPGIATVSSTGLGISRAVGTASITASYAGVSGQTTLTVSPATLVSLSITPSTASVPLGGVQQFAATGTFGDGSVQNVTNAVTWSSTVATVAMIDSSGLATSKGTGSTTIVASAGSITSNETSLTVLPAALQSIAVTPADSSLALGTIQQFTATGTYTDGSTQVLTSTVTWLSSMESVAMVSASGAVTGVELGDATISASGGSITGATTVTVSPAQLVSIAITPAIPAIPLGAAQQFTATGTFTDRSTQDLTATAHWSSSDGTVATISNGDSTNGLASSMKTGTTSISATFGSVSGSTVLTVNPAVLVSITVSPANWSIAPATDQQYTATGVYSDSTTKILTSVVAWSSSSPAVATIDESGMARTIAPGDTLIVASSGRVTGTATLTVTSTVLLSITISPEASSIPLGTTQQFSASGSFSDGTTQDLASSVHWSSSDPTVATVSNSTSTHGLASGLAVGYANISATWGSVSGTTSLTVTPAQLVNLTVSPQNPSIPLGRSQQFTASGSYTDQSTKDVTSDATWTSSSATVAVVSNSTGSQGLATSSGVGSTTIAASMPAGFASTTLTVAPAQLISITVTPASAAIALGTQRQFTATGTYGDSTTANITTRVNWSSSLTSVATISSGGNATSTGQGTTTITAAYGGISGTASLVITAPLVVGLQTSPSNPSVILGAKQQFTATATYTDSSTQNVTNSASWTSSYPSVATINSSGLATSAGLGTTTIAGSYDGRSDSTTLAVSNGVGLAADPIFSPNSGTGNSINVTMYTATTPCNSSSYIRYTLDGTMPTIRSSAGTSVLLNAPGTYTVKAGVFSCPGYADSAISASGTYTINLGNVFSSGFEAGNLSADGWSACGNAGCTQETSTYVTPPNPGSLSLGKYSRQFIEPTLYRYNLLTHTMTPAITSGTLYTRFYMNLGSSCSGGAFWLAALLSDDVPGYDTSVYIMTRSDNQLEMNVITSTTAYVHTSILGGLAMAHWYRVELSVPVSTSPTAAVEMRVFDGDSSTPLPGGVISLTSMVTVYKGGTGHKELDLGASNVQTLCASNSPATVTIDNVAMGTTGWLGATQQSFQFGLLSDTNGDYTVLPGISKNLAARNPSFVLFPGDVAQDTPVSTTSFKNAMNGGTSPGNGLFAKTFAVKGNHDQTGTWSGYFDFQAAATSIGASNFASRNSATSCGSDFCKAYSFDFSGTHFVGIDNSGLGVASMPDDLVTWLDGDLTIAETRGAKHAFLFWHGPTYWAVTDHASDASAHLIQVLNVHPIIAAIGSGHEHLQEYVRLDGSHSFKNGSVLGPIEQLMSAGADEELYDYAPARILASDWAAGNTSGGFFGYSTVTVTGNTIDVHWYNTSNVQQKALTFFHSR
jgi:uncharacterized protein YjdB